jgi:hypothetical protein
MSDARVQALMQEGLTQEFDPKFSPGEFAEWLKRKW